MYQVIMVPTDGSGFDRGAIRVGVELADRFDASLRLVRVDPGSMIVAGAPGAVAIPVFDSSAFEAKAAELEQLAVECRELTEAPVHAVIEHGPVPDALTAHALRHDVDLIVISSHGRGGIARMSLGSVTDILIRRTRLPVLVVKPRPSYLAPMPSASFRRILVPLDGSSLAEQALRHAVDLGAYENAEIILFRVEPVKGTAEATTGWDPVAAQREYLDTIAERLRRKSVKVRIEIAYGFDTASTILEAAEYHRADLIAIATHGRGGLARIIRGSVADEVMRRSGITTLVFHPTAEAAPALDLSFTARSSAPSVSLGA